MFETLASLITARLQTEFSPEHLEVINESSNHNVPEGSETHFKVVVVTPRFEGKSLVQRHRRVQDSLRELFTRGLHALSIVPLTPKEWKARQEQIPVSPDCRGGSARKSVSSEL